jgi:hypothetical protein
MTLSELALVASTHGKPPTRLRARVAVYARNDRMKRALRRFLPIFGAACAVVLIPPHIPWFLLVSSTGAVLALQRFRQEREVLELGGPCPDCGDEQRFPPPAKLPAIERCPACGAFLKLEEAA